jgi:hypothetical protein
VVSAEKLKYNTSVYFDSVAARVIGAGETKIDPGHDDDVQAHRSYH